MIGNTFCAVSSLLPVPSLNEATQDLWVFFGSRPDGSEIRSAPSRGENPRLVRLALALGVPPSLLLRLGIVQRGGGGGGMRSAA